MRIKWRWCTNYLEDFIPNIKDGKVTQLEVFVSVPWFVYDVMDIIEVSQQYSPQDIPYILKNQEGGCICARVLKQLRVLIGTDGSRQDYLVIRVMD